MMRPRRLSHTIRTQMHEEDECVIRRSTHGDHDSFMNLPLYVELIHVWPELKGLPCTELPRIIDEWIRWNA